MTVSFPESLVYGRITGHITLAVDDGPDEDDLPDPQPAVGKITFTPSVNRVFFSDLNRVIVPKPITRDLDSQGRFNVMLVANNSENANPTGWTWNVTVSLEGESPWASNLVVEGGTETDIADHPEFLVPSPGVIITKGDPGPPPTITASAITLAVGNNATVEVVGSDGIYELIFGIPTINTGDGPGGAVTSVNGLAGDVTLTPANLGAAPEIHTHGVDDIENLQSLLDNKQPLGNYQPAGEYQPAGDYQPAGNYQIAGDYQPAGDYATLVGGVIPTSQLPPIALTTVHPVTTEAEMLQLVVEVGDVAVRPDGTWILGEDDPASLESWIQISTPGGDGAVASINGQVGAVVLGAADVGALPDTYTPPPTDWGSIPNRPAAYPPSAHDHDTRYYTQGQIDAALGSKSDSGHTHDSRYYTEAEVDAMFTNRPQVLFLAAGASVPANTPNNTLIFRTT